ncbi:MAG: NYN domain-containing protein [Bacteroidota bacterium]
MAAANDNVSMALFCDFENVALGVRDAQYEKFDIRPVLERLLAKGSIVVKKAYCDWERYKGFKATMHEANFELIEIPHVRQSGKNSADIRLVVDALDLCYTKSHVDTFVIISGDSDFSPLVSKLRENAKQVIGVGVKQSTSDLLIANCDEFIYYDDLVRDREAERHNGGRRESREAAPRRTPEEEGKRREKLEARKTKAVELAVATFADLIAVRGENERIWASVLKEVIKRRNPGFNETYFGFRSFGNLLEEAANRGLLGFGRDDKSGAYVTRALPRAAAPESEALPELAAKAVEVELPAETGMPGDETPTPTSRRRGGRRPRQEKAGKVAQETVPVAEMPAVPVEMPVVVAPMEVAREESSPVVTERRRGGRRPRQEKPAPAAEQPANSEVPVVVTTSAAETPAAEAANKPRSRAARTPRSRKAKATVGEVAE